MRQWEKRGWDRVRRDGESRIRKESETVKGGRCVRKETRETD